MKINTYLPLFSGFYNTIWDDYTDRLIENELCHFKSEYDLGLEYDDLEINWEEYHLELSKMITSEIEDVLKEYNLVKSVSFDNLHSPKFYNYRNDSINVDIEIDQKCITIIKNVVHSNFSYFEELVHESTTSTIGFIPYYKKSDFIINEKYINPQAFEHEHHLGFILDACLLILEIEEVDILDKIEYINILPIENYNQLTTKKP